MKSLMVCVLMMASTLVFAGAAFDGPVSIGYQSDGSGQAEGEFGDARFSDNDVEYVACHMRAAATGATSATRFVTCRARDAQGVVAFCYSENPQLIDSLNAMTAHSFLIFRWNAAGECIYMGSNAGSQYLADFRDLGLGAPGDSGGRRR